MFIKQLLHQYNGYHIWNTYHVPGIVLGTLHALSYLILTTLGDVIHNTMSILKDKEMRLKQFK